MNTKRQGYTTKSGLRVEMLQDVSPISGYRRLAKVFYFGDRFDIVAYSHCGHCIINSPHYDLEEER